MSPASWVFFRPDGLQWRCQRPCRHDGGNCSEAPSRVIWASRTSPGQQLGLPFLFDQVDIFVTYTKAVLQIDTWLIRKCHPG